MASKFTHDNRMLKLETPLGKDYLLLNKMTVNEGISQLFTIEAEVLREEKEGWKIPEPIDYKKILGQVVAIRITQEEAAEEGRTFGGLVSEFTLGWRSERFSIYQMKIVPIFWVYTQNTNCRIFQQKTVPSIIKDVLKNVQNSIVWETEYDYKPRNYCVQYRESDFDFISRLMEEEGIYYYFEHEDGAHKMVISDRPQFGRNVPGRGELHFVDTDNSERFSATMVREWGTDYRIGPGLFSFRDHHIQQPGKKLATSSTTKFTSGNSAAWEVYDYSGGYAKKYDGIDPGGSKVGDLDNIIPDGKNRAKVASEVLDASFKTIQGKSDCSSLIAGYLFKLIDHPVKEENGQYVITSITHKAAQSPPYDRNDSSYSDEGDAYANSFNVLAHARDGAVPFRPEPDTPKPIIYGAQTAVVVGTPGEEIYTDDYGRIKVQFHWDREGRTDGSDSCWLPVAQTWAGNGWGSMFIPRVGMEVIVHFLEGDPDQPIVSGCVYNPANMPPYKLPDEKTKSTIKTDSTKGGGGFNELRFEDKKGDEQIFIHGQKDIDIRIKNDRREWIGNDRHLIVHRDKRELIERDEHKIVDRDLYESIGVKGGGDYHREVKGKIAYKTGGGVSHEIGGSLGEKISQSHSEEAGMDIYIKAGMKVIIEAGVQLTLKGPGGFIDINPAGVTIQGTMVLINSGGAAGTGQAVSLVSPQAPEKALIADNADPGSKAESYKNQIAQMPAFDFKMLNAPAHKPAPPPSPSDDPDTKKVSWIEIKLLDEDNLPVPGEKYVVTLPDGKVVASGTLDNEGFARVDNIDPGNCKVTFPNRDGRSWEKT